MRQSSKLEGFSRVLWENTLIIFLFHCKVKGGKSHAMLGKSSHWESLHLPTLSMPNGVCVGTTESFIIIKLFIQNNKCEWFYVHNLNIRYPAGNYRSEWSYGRKLTCTSGIREGNSLLCYLYGIESRMGLQLPFLTADRVKAGPEEARTQLEIGNASNSNEQWVLCIRKQ